MRAFFLSTTGQGRPCVSAVVKAHSAGRRACMDEGWPTKSTFSIDAAGGAASAVAARPRNPHTSAPAPTSRRPQNISPPLQQQTTHGPARHGRPTPGEFYWGGNVIDARKNALSRGLIGRGEREDLALG